MLPFTVKLEPTNKTNKNNKNIVEQKYHGVGRMTARYLEYLCGTLISPFDFRVHFSYKYEIYQHFNEFKYSSVGRNISIHCFR